MSDPITIARSAREGLSRALGQLQAPGAPDGLLAVAEPIAAAVGLLRGIEIGSGAPGEPAAREALLSVRRALGLLQEQLGAHPTVDDAVELVAESLSLVHDLARAAGTASRAAATTGGGTRSPTPERRQDVGAARPRPPAGPRGGPEDGFVAITADLAAHSASNFYRGLSGSDVVNAGGIFVATYRIPAVGQPVLLRIALPGGYEFEARGVVRWTRDAPESGALAPPGFGARFTDITPEGRQLVARYVRNREPLLHDDP